MTESEPNAILTTTTEEPTTLVRLPKTWRRALISCFISVALTLILSFMASIYFSQRSYEKARQSERQICGIIVTLDDVYKQTPPTTATGVSFATKLHAYRVALGC